MPQKLPKIITYKEFNQLLDELIKIERKVGAKRKKVMRQVRLSMILGFKAGMRISEITGYKGKENIISPLTRKQFDDVSIRIIQGKGKKDRIVPKPKEINETALKLLPIKITRRTIQRFVTELGKKVLNKEISFHTLRHGFASHLINSGRPLHEVQMLLGHSRLDTTGIYLHANPKEAVEKAREIF